MTPLRSFLTPSFRKLYADLPGKVQRLARVKYGLFMRNPYHPSLEFQAKGKVWTVAIARRVDNDLHWVWIGSHEAYNHLLGRLK